MILLAVGGGYGLWNQQLQRDKVYCRARVDGRKDTRAVFVDLYDYVEQIQGPNEDLDTLRKHLDLILPNITFASCMEEIR